MMTETRKLRYRKISSRIPEQNLKETFEGILRRKDDPVYPPDCTDRGPLDYEITIEELKDASYILRMQMQYQTKCYNVY